MNTTDPPTDWRDAVEGDRAKKERFFRDGPRSPLPPEHTGEDFPGLDYYDPDPSYRYELPLHEHDDVEEVTVGTSAGSRSTARR